MRLLLDTCVWGGAATTLVAAGHDARWMGEIAPDPGDEAVLDIAFDEGRVLITLDKAFWGVGHRLRQTPLRDHPAGGPRSPSAREPTLVRRLDELSIPGDLVEALIRGDVSP